MKRLLTTMTIAALTLSPMVFSSNALAMTQMEKMQMMRHVTPMPSLMSVAKKHAEMLALSAEQKVEMKKWADVHGPLVNEKAKEIMALEKKINAATLAGEGAATINKLANSVNEGRQYIIDTKLRCRDNLQKILNKDQWTKVIDMYKKMHIS